MQLLYFLLLENVCLQTYDTVTLLLYHIIIGCSFDLDTGGEGWLLIIDRLNNLFPSTILRLGIKSTCVAMGLTN